MDSEKIEQEAARLAIRHVKSFPPFYGQTPTELLRSKRIRPQAKALFALLHSYSQDKQLANFPKVRIAKATLAKDLDVSEEMIRIWINMLKEEGWIESKRQGYKSPNLYTLYPRSRKTWLKYVAMKRVHLMVNYDGSLIDRLNKSIKKPVQDSGSEAKIDNEMTTKIFGTY